MAHQLLINEPPLQVLPTLALKIGLNEAIVLQQVHYWLNPNFNKKRIEGRYWVYNSCEEWGRQFKFWSKNTIKRTLISLQAQELLIVGAFHRDKFDRSKWYSIDYDKLQGLETSGDPSVQNGPFEEPKMSPSINPRWVNGQTQNGSIEEPNLGQSLTETTSRDYTETNTHRRGAREGRPWAFRPEQPSDQPQEHPSIPYPSQRPAVMLALWNGSVRKAEQALELTAERKHRLARCLADAFEDDLDCWRDYCDQISRSPFLMGKGERGWKITLNWALDAKHVRKILDGDFQQQPSPGKDPALKVKDEPAIDLSRAHPLWAQVCKRLIESLGAPCFNSWMAELVPEGLDGEHPVLRAPTKFVRDTVDQRHKSHIEDALKACNPAVKTVSISVAVPAQHQQRG